MGLEERIILPPIKIVGEDEEGYNVLYDNAEVYIAKTDRSSFSLSPVACSQTMGMQLSIIPEARITQDSNAPKEFILAMMFHELREKEYLEAGFNNAHERALNDEFLFVLKNLDPSERERYFIFADNYRQRELEKSKQKEIKIRSVDKSACSNNFNFYIGVRLLSTYVRRLLACTNEETADRMNKLTKPCKEFDEYGTVHFINMVSPDLIFNNFEGFEDWSKKGIFKKEPVLVTGSTELRDFLSDKGLISRLYNPLEDPEPFDRLKRTIEE